MRIWDLDPGFLNDRSLLGEHRELHGIVSILVNRKKGYSRHPETLRWRDCLGGLAVRHRQLVAEMDLRGFQHRSPLPGLAQAMRWPAIWIDPPAGQYQILGRKYLERPPGRIPLPRNCQELWARHKYSVMARDYNAYRRYGSEVAAGRIGFARLAPELIGWLRTPPPAGALDNALLHMWGYVSTLAAEKPPSHSQARLLAEIRRLAMDPAGPAYLKHSTALGELACWCGVNGSADS